MEFLDGRRSDRAVRPSPDGSRPSGRRKAVLLVNLAVTAALLGCLLWRVDWVLMISALDRIQVAAVGFALSSFLAIAALETMRLRVVLTPFSLRWIELARLHVIGTFFGNFLPGQLGADLYKVVVLRPFDGSAARPLSLVLLLRAIGLAVLLAAVLAGIPFYGPALLQQSVSLRPDFGLTMLAAVGATIVALVAMLWRPRFRTMLAERGARFVSRAHQALRGVTGRNVAGLVGLSILVLMARALVVYFLAVAVGSVLDFADAMFVVALATMITLTPISFAGWGLREGAVTLLLVQLAMVYEEAVLIALTGRAFILLLSGAGGIWLVCELAFGKRAPAT